MVLFSNTISHQSKFDGNTSYKSLIRKAGNHVWSIVLGPIWPSILKLTCSRNYSPIHLVHETHLELVPLSSLQSRQLCRNDRSLKEEKEGKKEHGDMTLLDDNSYDDGHDHS